jgi:flagellar basal-body rod modification protein FlgD
MTTINTNAASANTAAPAAKAGLGSIGEKEFLLLLTTELKQQDPTQPVDQKDMLGQMAQFSSLSAVNTSNVTLTDIAAKLDTLISATKASGAVAGAI